MDDSLTEFNLYIYNIMGEEFDINLLSNVAPNIFPNNTPYQFSTPLAEEISLDGRWEVGVRKIMYPTDIGTTSTDDKVFFYNKFSADRTSVVPFKRGTDAIDKLPFNITVKNEELTSGYYAKHGGFPEYVTYALETNSEFKARRSFTLDYARKQKKAILNVNSENTVIEIDEITEDFLGMKGKVFTIGSYWAWSARVNNHTKNILKKVLNFTVYDLTYYEKSVCRMVFKGNKYVCNTHGIEIREDGSIVTTGKVDMAFFDIDAESKGMLYRGDAHSTPTIFQGNKSMHKYPKLENKEDWSTLTPTVTVWMNWLKKEEYRYEELETLTLKPEKEIKGAQGLVKVLNDDGMLAKNCKVEYDESTKRFNLKVGKKYGVKFSNSLYDILGFDEKLKDRILNDTLIQAIYFPTLNRSVRSLIIYSNIVEVSFIGNVKAPIIATCTFQTGSLDINANEKEFLNPTYVPLNRNNIDQIDIAIYDEAGSPVPFLNGQVLLTLHFRKRKLLF